MHYYHGGAEDSPEGVAPLDGAAGDLYQISNQVTLGRSEAELIDDNTAPEQEQDIIHQRIENIETKFHESQAIFEQ